MTSRSAKEFWAGYDKLPAHVKKLAKEAYEIFERDPFDRRLHFERKHGLEEVWSVRILNSGYRALGFKPRAYETVWFYWLARRLRQAAPLTLHLGGRYF